MSSIDADREHGHSFESARAVECSCVDGPQTLNEADRLNHQGLCFFRIARDKGIAVKRLINFGQQVSGFGLESRNQWNVVRKSSLQVFAGRAFRELDVADSSLFKRDWNRYVD